MLAPKKDGLLGLCGKLKIESGDKTLLLPIPRTDKCIDSLGDALICSTPDNNRGYWQVEIEDADCEKNCIHLATSIIGYFLNVVRTLQCTWNHSTHNGLHPIISQMAINFGVLGLQYHFFTNHRRTCGACLHRIVAVAQSRRQVEPGKSKWVTEKIISFGCLIDLIQLELTCHTMDAMRNLDFPWLVVEPKSFLWFCNVFQRFIPSFVSMSTSLITKLERRNPNNLTISKDQSLVAASLLTSLCSNGYLTLDTNTWY